MVLHQPGVSMVDRINTIRDNTIESAVPLFIGYTEKITDESYSFITSFSDYEEQFGGPHCNDAVLYYTVKHFFDNGGCGGYIYSIGTYNVLDENALDNSRSLKSYILNGIQDPDLARAVSAETNITLLSFPDAVLLEDNDITLWHTYWHTMLSLCRLRCGLFTVLQAPDSQDHALQCLNNFNTEHGDFGGVWWPRLVTPYMKNNNSVIVPPCGAVLAAIQNTDATKGVWCAPANIVLENVTCPVYSFKEKLELSYSGTMSLNLIKSFAGRGTLIWGARTLSQDTKPSLKYIQNRRLISWCESNVINMGRMYLFEPNNQLTWYKYTGLVSNWLRRLWQQGGLYGEQEKDAFHVMLGLGETMTEMDVKEGRMIISIKLSISAPAEFIKITLSFNMNSII